MWGHHMELVFASLLPLFPKKTIWNPYEDGTPGNVAMFASCRAPGQGRNQSVKLQDKNISLNSTN